MPALVKIDGYGRLLVFIFLATFIAVAVLDVLMAWYAIEGVIAAKTGTKEAALSNPTQAHSASLGFQCAVRERSEGLFLMFMFACFGLLLSAQLSGLGVSRNVVIVRLTAQYIDMQDEVARLRIESPHRAAFIIAAGDTRFSASAEWLVR